MKIYLVGGAVRDRLLGRTAKEDDWVVVGATEQMMLDQGFRHLNRNFPVFLHPETGDEYALARCEIKTGVGYHGFTIQATPDVTLEQDLLRRDLTINAIAEDLNGDLTDPCHGQQDLQARLLRHITPAFVEDPVRVLRTARFAADIGAYGFEVADDTQVLMQQMSVADDFNHLKPERVWREFKGSLVTTAPWCFLQVLHQCGALQRLIPLLDQHYSIVIPVLKRATAISDDPVIRFAALFYWPVKESNANIKILSHALRVEKPYSDLLQLVVKSGARLHDLQMGHAEEILKLFEQSKAIRNTQVFDQLLQVALILWPEKHNLIDYLKGLLPVVVAVSAETLQRTGLQGRVLGDALRQLRLQAIRSFENHLDNPLS